MKTTLFVLLILSTAAAVGQASGGISSYAQPLRMSAGTPEHATQHEMAQESPLVGGRPNTYTVYEGERPLWEFGPVSEPIPLGDVARAYRQQKAAAKKAEVILDKQGS